MPWRRRRRREEWARSTRDYGGRVPWNGRGLLRSEKTASGALRLATGLGSGAPEGPWPRGRPSALKISSPSRLPEHSSTSRRPCSPEGNMSCPRAAHISIWRETSVGQCRPGAKNLGPARRAFRSRASPRFIAALASPTPSIDLRPEARGAVGALSPDIISDGVCRLLVMC